MDARPQVFARVNLPPAERQFVPRQPAVTLLAPAWRRLIAVAAGAGSAAVATAVAALAGARGAAAVLAVLTVAGAAGTVVLTLAARGEVEETVVQPLRELALATRRVSGGELAAPPPRQGAAEVLQISDDLAALSGTLAAERRSHMQEASQLERRASMVRTLLRVTQEVGSSLQIERVLDETARAAVSIGGHAAAVIWLHDAVHGGLDAVWDTRTGGRPERPPLGAGEGSVGRAASQGQMVMLRGDAGRDELAIPIVLGLTTLGVIELVAGEHTHANRADDLDALEVLARHAATAIEASRLHGEMERRSETDGLTRVFNRRRFDIDLRLEVTRAVRYGRPLALAMVDVDHFKSINDTFGHQQGDEVLKQVGAVLLRECRATDGAYRYGGEEFAVLLRDTDPVAAHGVAERFRLRIREGVATLGLPRDVTASLGVAAVSERADTLEKLVEQADAALYRAKQGGRNRVVVAE